MSTVQVSEVPLSDWDSALTGLSDRTVFHGAAWLAAASAAHRLHPRLMTATQDGRLIAAWPFLFLRKGLFRVFGSPLPGWATVYMGPLFDASADPGAAVAAILAESGVGRCSYCYAKVMDAERDIDLSPFGFRRRKRYRTYILDLCRTEETLWAGLEGRCRTDVRKARKHGVDVRTGIDPDFVNDFWGMSVEVFERSGIKPTYSRAMLEAVCSRLGEAGQILAMSAFKDDVRVAAIVLPHDHQTAYYWAGASHDEARKLSANPYVMWEAIRAARQIGLKRLDLVSVYGGPGRFKRSFGPEERKTATHWEYFGSPVTRVAKAAYERYLRMRQRIG